MPFIRDEQIEVVARRLRKDGGVDDRFCPDLLYVLNEFRKRGKIADYKIVPDEAMPRDEARYDPNTKILYIPERVYRALDHISRGPKIDRRRARFTIAHELVHIDQEPAGVRFRGVSGARAERLVSEIRSEEYVADAVAAAFLMPAHLARPDMAAEHISELFDTNISAARIRKNTLEKMDRRVRREIKPLPSGIEKLLRDAEKQGFRVTSLKFEEARKKAEAMRNGYEGEPCGKCGRFTLVRDGAQIKCDTCGSTSRCS